MAVCQICKLRTRVSKLDSVCAPCRRQFNKERKCGHKFPLLNASCPKCAKEIPDEVCP